MPLLEKTKVVQSIGAIAAVIVDNGQCNSDMSNCGLIGSIDEVRKCTNITSRYGERESISLQFASNT